MVLWMWIFAGLCALCCRTSITAGLAGKKRLSDIAARLCIVCGLVSAGMLIRYATT